MAILRITLKFRTIAEVFHRLPAPPRVSGAESRTNDHMHNPTKTLKTLLVLFCAVIAVACAPRTDWYPIEQINKPYIRWWWLGSIIDEEGITKSLEGFREKGIGGVEITPLYGIQGHDDDEIEYLSPRWMELLSHAIKEGRRLGISIEMSNSCGWPFGGPWIEENNAAQKFGFNSDTTEIFSVPTGQKVKRAGKGGEGLVMNHYSKEALRQYLGRFDEAFRSSMCLWPHTFFDDSFEVYKAGWDDALPERFLNEHGYSIDDELDLFALNDGSKASSHVIADYRETLGNMYMENFVIPWNAWAHDHGIRTRIQAHGAPANLIDVYAEADCAECEAFGQTEFDIRGLHRTGPTRKNDSDPSVFKFASSATHISGKKYTSCESLTWLTEHFHTTLALCKPEIDLILSSGVNHVYLHGSTYSPESVPFPGWKFYATINISPTDPLLWDNLEPFTTYIARCQAFLSAGKPDADLLMYFPINDIWHNSFPTQFMMLDIHKMDVSMPEFKRDVLKVMSLGYDVDYVSDKYIHGANVSEDGNIILRSGAEYKAMVIPETEFMPEDTKFMIEQMKQRGARIIAMSDMDECTLSRETIAAENEGVHFVRRNNEVRGKNYFITNLGPRDMDGWYDLTADAREVELFDAMSGRIGMAQFRNLEKGGISVRLQIPSGASMLVKCFGIKPRILPEPWKYYTASEEEIDLGSQPWSLHFEKSAPEMPDSTYSLPSLQPWHRIEGGDRIQAKGVYTTHFTVDKEFDNWRLDLGDVRESAEVIVNGHNLGKVFCAPFCIDLGKSVHTGDNELVIKVTNLPANRIAEMDRNGETWRIFKDVNIAAVNSRQVVTYEQANSYGWWETVPSGLNSTVRLIPLIEQ